MWVWAFRIFICFALMAQCVFAFEGKMTRVVFDSEQSRDIQALLNQPTLYDFPITSDTLTSDKKPVWYRLKLPQSGGEANSDWVLTTDKFTEGNLSLYWVQDNKLLNSINYSRFSQFSPEEQIFPHIRFSTQNASADVFVLLDSPSTIQLFYRLLPANEFEQYRETRLFWYGLELGLLYFVATFMLLIALVSKHKYLSYLSVYLYVIGLQYSISSGCIYYYLPNALAGFLSSLNSSFLILSLAACLMFHIRFTGLKQLSKPLYKWNINASKVFLIGAVLVALAQFQLTAVLQSLMFVAFIALISSIYYLSHKTSKPFTKLLFIAWLPALLLEVTWLFKEFGYLPQSELVIIARWGIILHVGLLCSLIYFRDKQQQDAFHFYTLHDKDTGLPNRRALNRCLDKLVDNQKGHALLLFSPKMLEQVKMSFGVEYAHQRLKVLFSKLQEQLSRYLSSNKKDQGDVVYRVNDGVFAVVVTGELSLSQIEQYVCIIAAVFEEGVEYKGFRLSDQVTVGVAHYPTHAINAELLLQRGLLALSGHSSISELWHIYDPTIAAMAARRLKISAALLGAIEKQQFSLYLQPQVELSTGKVHGAEGLLRWQHPDLGFVPPDEFIPIAEASGQINTITEWVLTQGLMYQKKLVEQYPSHILSLNISGKDLSRRELMVQLITQLNEQGLNAAQILLEVTESVALAGEGKLKGTLEDYRRLGVKIGIDDYGTGYSSLAYLSELGFDELKIDKQFVLDIETSSKNQTICRATCDMAQSLGSYVVAEGVEDLPSYNRLKNYGCDIAQGYFISRPLPFKDYLEWMKQADQAVDVKQLLVR